MTKYIADLKNLAREFDATWEIIAVDDGSSDRTKKYLLQYAKEFRSFKVVDFDGRYGKQNAITAGFEFATGDYVFVADMDLLNPEGLLTNMFAEGVMGATGKPPAQIMHGYREFIGGEKTKAVWSDFWTRLSTKFFAVHGYYNGKVNVALYSRDVADIIASNPPQNKYMRTMDNWIGYVPVEYWYPSNLGRSELLAKTKELKERHGVVAGIKRDTMRENSNSKWFSLVFLCLTAVAVAFGLLTIKIPYFSFVVFLFSGIFVALSFLFFLKSVLLKRIGFVHYRDGEVLYTVTKVLNG
jgi:glycosyltransferase involved in cell wall biosynthesis